MTSSLQHQEVRIPAIPLSSSPPPPPIVFFPTRLAPGHFDACLPASSRPLFVWQVSFLQSSLRSPGWGGRETGFLFDYEKTEPEKECDLPRVTQLGGKGPDRNGLDHPTFSRAQKGFNLPQWVLAPRET